MRRSKKQSKVFLSTGTVKYVEAGLVVLLVLLFIALAVLHSNGFLSNRSPSATPAPTEPPLYVSERELNAVLDAASLRQSDGTFRYAETGWDWSVETDSLGVARVCVTAPMHADAKDDSAFHHAFNAQNAAVREQVSGLLDVLAPLFGGTAADAERIARSCSTVLKSAQPSRFSLHGAEVLVEAAAVGVRITFSRP